MRVASNDVGRHIMRVGYPMRLHGAVLSSLMTCGHYMYHHGQHSTILRSAHTVYLCVLCGSENKQRLLPYTAIIDWFL